MTEIPLEFQASRQTEENQDPSQAKKHFEEPKLTFIQPKLKKHGDATKITAGFFGGFSPSPD